MYKAYIACRQRPVEAVYRCPIADYLSNLHKIRLSCIEVSRNVYSVMARIISDSIVYWVSCVVCWNPG